MNIWDSFTITDKSCFLRQIGSLKIWIRYTQNEWHIASDRIPDEKEMVLTEDISAATDEITWNRFIIPGKDRQVALQPVTPDRPIVVKPDSPVSIAANGYALFYVLFPLWVSVTVGNKVKKQIIQIPSQFLSNTWFGELHNGELCYTVKTWARRTLNGLTPRPHQIVCPVSIKNNSDMDLDFTRLCIRTEFLSIYRGTSWFWTNKVNVQFRGASHTSRIQYETAVPDFESPCRSICTPRQRPPKDFSIKSFDTFTFRKLTGG